MKRYTSVMLKLFHFPQTLLRVRCSMALRSVSYFRERDQGLDHVHHGARDRGRGEVGQGHVGVNGLVEDEGRGQIMRCFSLRTKTWMGRRKIIRVRVAGQRRGISGTWGGAIYSVTL